MSHTYVVSIVLYRRETTDTVTCPKVFVGVSGMDVTNKVKHFLRVSHYIDDKGSEATRLLNEAGTIPELTAWINDYFSFYAIESQSHEIS